MKKITVAIDIKQPQSYLALGPTRETASQIGLEIDWLPITVDALVQPSSFGEGTDRGSRHLHFRALHLERNVELYAAGQGLVVQNIYRNPDSTLAGMALLQARDHSANATEEFLSQTFKGYWNETVDIEDESALRSILLEAGVTGDPFSGAARRDQFALLQQHWEETKVIGAPGYVVGDEFFLGRAHLPMIRWISGGKVGPVPI